MADNESPQVRVVSDEDWKSRVKAEDAARDSEFRATHHPVGAEPQQVSGASTSKGSSEARPSGSASTGSANSSESGASPEHSSTRSRPQQEESAQSLPDATFEGLVGMLATQAMVALGILPNPATGKGEQHLPMARYFIDLISVLEQKTSGKLSSQEAAGLDQTLHSLRMTYVELSRQKG